MEKLSRKLKTIWIHWKQYVEVKERILALVENESPYSIETDYQYFPESAMWVVKAKLTMLESWEVFTGLAQEKESDGNINKTSALENAETSAVGRACAFAWIGIVDWIASVDEINKATNRASTPIGWEKNWLNFNVLKKAIDSWTDTEVLLTQWILDNKYDLSGAMRTCLRTYCDSGELIAPEFKK